MYIYAYWCLVVQANTQQSFLTLGHTHWRNLYIYICTYTNTLMSIRSVGRGELDSWCGILQAKRCITSEEFDSGKCKREWCSRPKRE